MPCYCGVILMLFEKYFQNSDAMSHHFVSEPKALEPSFQARCVSTLTKQGGLVLRQVCWQRFVTFLHHLVCTRSDRLPVPPSKPILRTQVPLLMYATLRLSLRALLGVTRIQRQPCRPNLYDLKDSEGGRLLPTGESVVYMGKENVVVAIACTRLLPLMSFGS